MKKLLNPQIIALGIIFIVILITSYFYQSGEISFLSSGKEKKIKIETVEVSFVDKEYKLSYQNKLSSTFNIADFEDSENWRGNGDFDYTTFLEGNSSFFVSSYDNQKAIVSLNKAFDIKDVLNFKFLVHLETNSANIEEFNLIFEGREDYKFPIRDLHTGWNLLVLAKKNFSILTPAEITEEDFLNKENLQPRTNIEKVVIELVSRPKTRTILSFDSLWAEKDKEYLNDWNSNSSQFLSIKKNKKSGGLLALNLSGGRAILKQGSGKNYTFQARFMPLRRGEFGFFLRGDYKSGYGYYLSMNGVRTDAWQIKKRGLFDERNQTIVLAKGRVSNFIMEKDKLYWLKAEMKGAKIVFYFSLNGKDFTKLGEARDDSYSSGGIGIFASNQNMFLIDEIQFFQ